MKISKTILFSLFLHLLAIYAAALPLKQMVYEERIFSIVLKDSPMAGSEEHQRDGTKQERRKNSNADTMKISKANVHHPDEGSNSIVSRYPEKNVMDSSQPSGSKTTQGEVFLPVKEDRLAQGLNEGYAFNPSVQTKGLPSAGMKVNVVLTKSEPATGTNNQSLLNQLRVSIERALTYPPLARKRNIEGTVVVRFKVNENGSPSDVRVVESSHYKILDDEAVKTVTKAAPLPPVQGNVEIPISFRLFSFSSAESVNER